MNQNLTYQPWEDFDGDCSKIWHDFVDEHGKVIVSADFSPYEYPSKSMIEDWFSAGCPDRYKLGINHPITHKQIKNYLKNQNNVQ